MKWIKRIIAQWVNEVRDEERATYSGENKVVAVSDVSNTPDDEPILRFKIYSATNGQILEFNRWDRKNDRTYSSVYIIDRDKDIGEYVNKCLSVELLK